MFQEALRFAESSVGPEHPLSGRLLGLLGELESVLGNHVLAERLLARSLEINERALGTGHQSVARTSLAYAQTLRKLNRKREAKVYEKRAHAIEASLNPEDTNRYTIDAQMLSARGDR
jgi:tetratricopeptide (TPR) repeat protein